MIASRKTWDLGSVPSARAAWKPKGHPPDGEYGAVARPSPLGLSLPRSRPRSRLGKERPGTGQPAFFTLLSG